MTWYFSRTLRGVITTWKAATARIFGLPAEHHPAACAAWRGHASRA
jgi:hypothetical protein